MRRADRGKAEIKEGDGREAKGREGRKRGTACWMDGGGTGGSSAFLLHSIIGTAFRHFDLLAPFPDPLRPLSFLLFFTSSSSLLSFLPSSLPF
jgi:hypothetical protein